LRTLALAAATAGSLLLAPAQFARGHFAGAVNTDWRQVLTKRKKSSKNPVLIDCNIRIAAHRVDVL
jgi:3-mercaptopyruvate sulfurtransferase SseA